MGRSRVFVLPVVVLFATVALAGCASDSSDATLDDASTSVIRGVVFDEAIRPLEGAAVTVRGEGDDAINTTTNADGVFGIQDLAPGSYFVDATKLGFTTVQQTVEVEAGVDNPPMVKLLLEQIPGELPFFQGLEFRGYIECSTSFLALCAVPNTEQGGNVTQDQFIKNHFVEQPPQWVQSEMIWDSTQQLSDRMWLWHSYANEGGTFQGSLPDPHVTGPSPLLIEHNETQAAARDLGDPNMLTIRIFSGDVEGTSAPDEIDNCYGVPGVACFANGPGFAIQQDFEVFTHLFYKYEPPEDWRFSDEPTVPGPEG